MFFWKSHNNSRMCSQSSFRNFERETRQKRVNVFSIWLLNLVQIFTILVEIFIMAGLWRNIWNEGEKSKYQYMIQLTAKNKNWKFFCRENSEKTFLLIFVMFHVPNFLNKLWEHILRGVVLVSKKKFIFYDFIHVFVCQRKKKERNLLFVKL